MTKSRLPNRLLSPMWRATNYIELHAGMQDPALLARKARERKESTAPVVVQEKTIRIGGGGGGGDTSGGIGTFVLKDGDTMGGDLGISKNDAAIKVISTNAGNSQIALYDTTDGGVLLFGVNGGGNLARSNAAGTWVENVLGFDSTGFLTINPDGLDQDLRVMGDVDPNVLYVDASTDRVGIGTAAPTQKLHVNGGIQVASTNKLNFFNTGYWIRASSGLELNTADYMLLEVGGAERMRIADTLITTQTGMTINGNTSVENGNFGVNKYGGIPELGVKSQIGAGYTPAFISIARWGAGGTATPNNEYVGALWFVGLNTGNAFTGLSKIDCNVGVNTGSGPPSNLRLSSVLANVEDTAINLDSRAAQPFIGINENARNVDTIIRGDLDLNLLVADASTDRVGVGTSTPAEKLDVRANMAIAGWIDFDEAIGAKLYTWSNQYGLAIESSEQRYFAASGARHSFRVGGYSGTDVMSLSGAQILINTDSTAIDTIIRGDVDANLLYVKGTTDRVGIGTSAPSTKFEVVGMSRFTLNGGTAVAINAPTAGQTAEIGFEDATSRKWVLMKTSANEFGIYDTVIGNTVVLTPGATGITYLNYGAHGRDTIIRGDLDNNLVFVDASTDRVGIGLNNPQVKFDVSGIIRALAAGVGVRISSAAPSQQAELWFDEAASGKWALFKDVNNDLAIFNALGGRTEVLISRTGGAVTLTNLAGSGSRLIVASNTGLLNTAGAVIDALQDVAITAPLAGQLLTYNGTVWSNAAPQQGIITLNDRTQTFAAKFGTTGTGALNFSGPGQIAIDTSGNIYVADTTNNRISKFDSAGTWLASATLVNSTTPTGICVVSSTTVYVLCRGTDITEPTRIVKYDSALNFQGNSDHAAFSSLGTGHITTDNTFLYFTAPTANKVYKVGTLDPSLPITIWGATGSLDREFITPRGIATGNNYIYVADSGNDRMQVFTKNGVFVTKWGLTGSDPGEFQNPYGVTVNKVGGHVFVTDTIRDDVQEFTFEGGYVGEFSQSGSADGSIQNAQGIATTTDGASTWVSDATQNRLQKFTATVTSETASTFAMNPEDFIVASDPTVVGQAYISLITPAKSLGALDDVVTNGEFTGQILTFNGANWVNAGAGSIMMAHGKFAGVASFSVDNCFTIDFANYKIVVNITSHSSLASQSMYMRWRSAGVDNVSAIYSYEIILAYSPGGAPSQVFATGGSSITAGVVGGTVDNGQLIDISTEVYDVSQAFTTRWISLSSNHSIPRIDFTGGGHNSVAKFDGFTFLPSVGTITGRYAVYAMGQQ